MALKIIAGAVEELGPAEALAFDAGPAGTVWRHVGFSTARKKPVRLDNVVASGAFAAHLVVGKTGRFAVYPHDGQHILCGYAGSEGLELATAETDPALIAANAIRLPAKRKIFWGVVLIPTLIGLFFAFDMIRAGRATLRAHPAPRRPSDRKLTRALKGQLYWPF